MKTSRKIAKQIFNEKIYPDVVVKDGNCWDSVSRYCRPDGYVAVIFVDIGRFYLHRLSYLAFKGDIPDGLVVMHACDNRRCCNPEHLTLGTQADNMKDMDHKGRRGIHRGQPRDSKGNFIQY